MIRISAFADEISDDLDLQIEVLRSESIFFLDLRGAWGRNVLELDDRQIDMIHKTLDAAAVRVAAIGSPIGKVPIDSPFSETTRGLERAIDLAHALGTDAVRIFSFYAPAHGEAVDPSVYREEVIGRVREMTDRARMAGVLLLHENEKGVYGDTVSRCVDLMQSVDDPHFLCVFDPANFIQCGQTPYPDGYRALRPWLRHVHVKDARRDGQVTAAGEGDARWPDLLASLRADGYEGFFSLEPHLSAAGQFGGYSGPDLFRHASQSFQRLLQTMAWDDRRRAGDSV